MTKSPIREKPAGNLFHSQRSGEELPPAQAHPVHWSPATPPMARSDVPSVQHSKTPQSSIRNPHRTNSHSSDDFSTPKESQPNSQLSNKQRTIHLFSEIPTKLKIQGMLPRSAVAAAHNRAQPATESHPGRSTAVPSRTPPLPPVSRQQDRPAWRVFLSLRRQLAFRIANGLPPLIRAPALVELIEMTVFDDSSIGRFPRRYLNRCDLACVADPGLTNLHFPAPCHLFHRYEN